MINDLDIKMGTVSKYQSEIDQLEGYFVTTSKICMFNVDFTVPIDRKLYNVDPTVYVYGMPQPYANYTSTPIFAGILRNTGSGLTKICYLSINDTGLYISPSSGSLDGFNEVRVAGTYIIY